MIPRSATQAIAVAVVLAAMALVVLDAGITNVALPTIAAAFDVEPSTSVLVASAYQLAVLMGLLPAAHLAERIGYRRLFFLGIVLFTAASALASYAPTFRLLVAARFLQGIGGAAILALGIALLRFALGTERLSSAIGWNALNVAVFAAAAPPIGAAILVAADWRWLFLVNVPIGMLTLAGARALPDVPPSASSISLASIGLHVGSAGLLFVGLQWLPERLAPAIGLIALAVAGYSLLIKVELPKPSPLVPFDLLLRRPFRMAVAASVFCFVAQSAGQLALPFYVQLGMSRSAAATGLVLACWPIAVALTSRKASRLAEQFHEGPLCAAGAAILSAGLVALFLLPAEASLSMLGFWSVVCGIGFGLFQVPNNRNLFLAAPPERSAAAGGMQGTARLAGQTSGSLLVTMLFVWSPIASAPRLAFAFAALFAIAAAFVSLGRSNIRSAPTGVKLWRL